MAEATPTTVDSDIFSFALRNDWTLNVQLSAIPIAIIGIAILLLVLAWRYWSYRRFTDFEIDSAELGIGDTKLSFKPNTMDRQIAYSIWVELSTRKIGLPIDIEHDVISEIYDSWYSFFGVTRELIKSIPVSKVRGDSTGKIIRLSIEVLNEGLRPHLTQWQARYRRWYDHQIKDDFEKSPQDIQKGFPHYDELCADLLTINNRLIKYRQKMNELVINR